MTVSTFNYFALFTATFVIVGFFTPLLRRFAIHNNIYDKPDSSHKTHNEPVPYLGGVAIMIGVLTVSYVTALSQKLNSSNLLLMTSVLAPALVLGLIGLWDDIKNLPPAPRFAIQTIAGIFTAWVMIENNTVGIPTGSKVIDVIITVFWIVGICNSINFFDNIDGGAAGTVLVTSIGIFVIGFEGRQYLIAALSVVIAGAMFGFLIWNKSPARIYMGDAGALFLGAVAASLTIRVKPQTGNVFTSLCIPVLLFAAPILDTCVAVFSRIMANRSPFEGGRDHLSHRLIKIGLSRKVSAITLWFISLIFMLLGVGLTYIDIEFQIAIVIFSVLWFAFGMVFFLKVKV